MAVPLGEFMMLKVEAEDLAVILKKPGMDQIVH